MNTKSSAHYQREYRKRLRDQGLVKKEVWVLPDHAKALTNIESLLRTKAGLSDQATGYLKDDAELWTSASLYEALSKHELFAGDQASVSLVEGNGPSLLIEMHQYGDLPLFLSVAGDQIVIESVLWSVDDVNDLGQFNDAVLKTHKYFPLSTISLEVSEGLPDYYHMFGALSASSILPNVVLEIEVLAANVIMAAEAYSEYLNFSVD